MSDFMKVDAFRLQQAAARSSSTSAVPADRDVDDFERAMRQVDEGDEGEGGRSGGDPSAQGGMAMRSPLDGLFGRMTAVVEAAPVTDPAALADRLLERILVAEPQGGGSEIRLMLGDDVLPGTEIRLLRGADGALSVSLVTENATAFQTLVAAQDSLRRRLEGLEGQEVRVEVTSGTDRNEAEDGDARRRSRGLPYEDGQA